MFLWRVLLEERGGEPVHIGGEDPLAAPEVEYRMTPVSSTIEDSLELVYL